MIERCIQIASVAHDGLLDQSGEKSIYHLVRVMLKLKEHGEDYAAIGVLHDILKDTSITKEHLKKAFINDFILEALDFTTRKENEAYFDYISRGIHGNDSFPVYKLADISDHLDPKRIDNISNSLVLRYAKAKDMIMDYQRKKSLEEPLYSTKRENICDNILAEYIGTSKSYTDSETTHYIKIHYPNKSVDIIKFNNNFEVIDGLKGCSRLNIEFVTEKIFSIDGDLNESISDYDLN